MKEELIIRQLNVITKWIDEINKKAKSIHDLDSFSSNTPNNLYVAVSDGQSTGKILFPADTISESDVIALLNFSLDVESDYSTLLLKNGEGDVLSSIDLDEIFNSKNTEIEERLNDLDFDETTAKPYEKYITHST